MVVSVRTTSDVNTSGGMSRQSHERDAGARTYWKTAGLATVLVAVIGLIGIIVQARGNDSNPDSSTQAPAPSSATPAPGTTATVGSTQAPTATTSTNPSMFTVLRKRDSEALPRKWALDVDTGRQAKSSFEDGMDLAHGSLALGPVGDAEMAQVNGQPNAPETCQNETQRISDVPVWLSRPQIKSGDQFCIYTNDGNLAMLKVIERHDEPRQELVYSITVWKREG
jgi:hypothetical protein